MIVQFLEWAWIQISENLDSFFEAIGGYWDNLVGGIESILLDNLCDIIIPFFPV
jgi:hypothetical protein